MHPISPATVLAVATAMRGAAATCGAIYLADAASVLEDAAPFVGRIGLSAAILAHGFPADDTPAPPHNPLRAPCRRGAGMSPVIRNSYAADAALEAAEAVIAARAWLSDEAARACLASMARALVALAREQAAAAGDAYFTPGVLARRLAAVEAAIFPREYREE